MSSTTQSEEKILQSVLDRWAEGIARREPEQVAAVFTEDAIFQGLHPYSVGRQGIAEYYESQPIGLAAQYRILETRRFAEDLVFGYLDVDFSFTDRPTLGVKLSVLLTRLEGDWYITHYQVSRLD